MIIFKQLIYSNEDNASLIVWLPVITWNSLLMNLFSDKATSFNTDATSSLGIEPFPSKYKSVSILEVPSLSSNAPGWTIV